MLQNINISNLDNSISQTSYYSDAYENSVQLEEHFQKINDQNQASNPNKNSNDKNNSNNDNNNSNNNDKNIYSNTNFVENNIENKNNADSSSDSSNSEVYESVVDESHLQNNNNMKTNKSQVNEINDKPKNVGNLRYINNNFMENNESMDILKYRNDKKRLFYDNKNDLKNQNKINEIINNKNINNVNLSNINIIINKGENFKSKKNNKKEINSNLSSIDEGNKVNKLSVNSTLSDRSSSIDIKNEKKSQDNNIGNNTSSKKKEADNNSKANDINSEDEIYSKKSEFNNNKKNENNSNHNRKINNSNINEITKSKAIDFKDRQSNAEKTDIKLSSFKKFNNSINTNNLDMASFDSVTVIKKKKKKNLNNSISKLSNSYNDNSSFLSFANSFLVNTIKFDGIKKDEIDLQFLSNLRTFDITYKKKEQKKYLKTLLELQHFFIDDIGSAIRVIKISENGKYLSAGMQCGKIILFEIIGYDYTKFEASYDAKSVMKYLNFINEKPYKTLNGHSQDVLGLDWSNFDHNLLLSCSTDKFVILWDVSLSEENCKIQSFDHENIVTCVSFCPTDKFKFASGCLDKFIRIWDFRDILDKFYNNNSKNINQDIESQNGAKIIDSELKNLKKLKKFNFQYFNIEEKITAISFYPSGDKIVIGTHNGKIIIYEIRPDNCFYKASFNCRNRIGKNSMGKKITSIEFLNKNYSVISSSDSRIRLISMSDGKLIHKYKGYANENSWIKSSIDYNYDVIITGSEDGLCYVWHLYNEEKKNLNYECFKPYSHEVVHCSLIVPEKCYCNFLKKIMKLTQKLLITSIIINGTNRGRLEILLNIEGKC